MKRPLMELLTTVISAGVVGLASAADAHEKPYRQTALATAGAVGV